jgi:hypothetical protein
METHVDGLEHTQAEFHEAFNDRIEDVEEMFNPSSLMLSTWRGVQCPRATGGGRELGQQVLLFPQELLSNLGREF